MLVIEVNWFKRLVSIIRRLKLRLKYHCQRVLVEGVEGKIWKSDVCIGGVKEILTKREERVWYLSSREKLIWVVFLL